MAAMTDVNSVVEMAVKMAVSSAARTAVSLVIVLAEHWGGRSAGMRDDLTADEWDQNSDGTMVDPLAARKVASKAESKAATMGDRKVVMWVAWRVA